MSNHDDFLKQFTEAPRPEFGETLLHQLRQLDKAPAESDAMPAEQVKPSQPTNPVIIIPTRPRRRGKDHYITMIASWVMMLMLGFILVVNVSMREETTVSSGSFAALPEVNGYSLQHLAWSTDGQTLFAATSNTIFVLDSTLEIIETIEPALNGNITALKPYEDALLIGDSAGTLSVWEISRKKLSDMRALHYAAITLIESVPYTDMILVAGYDGRITSLTVRYNRLHYLNVYTFAGQPSVPRGITVHPDGETVMVTMQDASTAIFGLSGNGILSYRPDAYSVADLPPASQVVFMPNGAHMLVAWWDTLRLLDSNTLSERRYYTVPNRLQQVQPLQVSTNGERVLFNNPQQNTAVWDFKHEHYVPIIERDTNSSYAQPAALHPDGTLVAIVDAPNQVSLFAIAADTDGELHITRLALNSLNRQIVASTPPPITLANIAESDFGQMTQLYQFGDGFLTHTLWSPDGTQLVVATTRSIRVYDDQLNLEREWQFGDLNIHQIAFSKNGRYLITGSNTGALAIWDVLTGRNATLLHTLHDSAVETIITLENGNILSRDEDGDFAWLQLNDDGTVTQIGEEMLASYRLFDVHDSPDGLRLVVGGRVNGNDIDVVQILQMTPDGELDTSTTGVDGQFGLFAHDGASLVVYQSQRLLVFDSDSMIREAVVYSPPDMATINHMQSDSTGRHILLIDYDRGLHLFDIDQESIRSVNNSGALLDTPANTISLHPRGDRVAVITSNNRVAIWQIDESRNSDRLTARQIASDTPVIGHIKTFVTGNNNLAAATSNDGSVLLFDSLIGTLLQRVDLKTWGTRNHDIAFSPDGQSLVVLGHDVDKRGSILNLMHVESALDGDPRPFRNNEPFRFTNDFISGFDFSPDGDTLITGGSRLRVWGGMRGIPYLQDDYVDDLRGLTLFAYNPTNTDLATVRQGSHLSILQAVELEARYSLRIAGRGLPESSYLRYTPDGDTIIMAVNNDMPQIFDATTNDLLFELEHSQPHAQFNDMVLSHNGRYLLMAQDSGVYVWDLDDLDNDVMSRRLPLAITPAQVAFSHDDTRLFVVGVDGLVRVYGIPQ